MSNFFNGGSGGTTFSSGGVTTNVIPKEDGAGGLKDSALTDNGTNVISTEPIQVPNGTSAANSIQLGGANNGIYSTGANHLIFSIAGADALSMAGFVGTSVNTTLAYGLGSTANGGADLYLGRRGAANFRLGTADLNGTPVAQTISVQNAITGSDLPGSTFTIDAPLGTGAGAGAKTAINRTLMKASGATAQTSVNGFIIGESKTLSNTSATATSLANISVPSNSGGGCWGSITVVATDGTNFDSETQSFNVSYVNKATVLTVGAPVITASTAASNSGSTTIGMTAIAGTNSVDIKVTPVFTTIVPTTVTAYITIINNGTGNVTIN